MRGAGEEVQMAGWVNGMGHGRRDRREDTQVELRLSGSRGAPACCPSLLLSTWRRTRCAACRTGPQEQRDPRAPTPCPLLSQAPSPSWEPRSPGLPAPVCRGSLDGISLCRARPGCREGPGAAGGGSRQSPSRAGGGRACSGLHPLV